MARQHGILKVADRFHPVVGWLKLGAAYRGRGHGRGQFHAYPRPSPTDPRNIRQVLEAAQSNHRRAFGGDAVQGAQFVIQNTDNDGMSQSLLCSSTSESHASTCSSYGYCVRSLGYVQSLNVTPMLVLLTPHLTNHIMKHSKLASANHVSQIFSTVPLPPFFGMVCWPVSISVG